MVITGPFNEDKTNYYIYANGSRYTINKETGDFLELPVGCVDYQLGKQFQTPFTMDAYLHEKDQCSKTMTIFLD